MIGARSTSRAIHEGLSASAAVVAAVSGQAEAPAARTSATHPISATFLKGFSGARGALAAAAGAVPADPWMVIGWGDASFYTAKGISLARVGDGLRALFKPGNPSVIRIFGVSRDPAAAYEPGVATPVALSPAGLDRMLDRMEASMKLSAGAPVRAKARTTPDEAFFDSVEHFSILRLCNHWTSDMLAAAGLPMTPLVDGLAPTLMADLSLRAGARVPH